MSNAKSSSLVQTSGLEEEKEKGTTKTGETPAPKTGGTPVLRKVQTALSILQLASFAAAAVAQFIAAMGGPRPAPESDEQQAAAEEGVKYRLANPGASVEAQHAAWCRDKKRLGWKYDATRSDEKKTHPNLVDFKKLPDLERARVRLFANTVDALKPLLANEDDPELRK